MLHQEQQTDLHYLKKTKEKLGQQGTSGQQEGNSKSKKCQRGKRSSKNSATQGSATQKRLDNEADCPLHGGTHTWGQCHQNQDGENFRPRRNGAITANTNTRRSTRPSGQFNNRSQGQYHTSSRQGSSLSSENPQVTSAPTPEHETQRYERNTRTQNKNRHCGYKFIIL